MKPWRTLATAQPLSLRERDGEYMVLVEGRVLMTSRRHASEAALGQACRSLPPRARVLIGGLGFGYTLRGALDALSPDAKVTVAEISAAIVEWNRAELAPLAGRPLEDPRVEVKVADVLEVLGVGPFDAILLDVDNGPFAVSRPENAELYATGGLARLHAALTPDGLLAVWSAGDDSGFGTRLRAARFEATVSHPHVPAADSSVLFVARRR